MIRFIHTADRRIGMKSAGLGAAAQIVPDHALNATCAGRLGKLLTLSF